jgi:hypothetical protein
MYNTEKRLLVASIESEIQRLANSKPVTTGSPDVSALKTAFAKLVDVLALGPEPETRDCPICGRKGMRDATVCGYCWSKTPPQASHEHRAVTHAGG